MANKRMAILDPTSDYVDRLCPETVASVVDMTDGRSVQTAITSIETSIETHASRIDDTISSRQASWGATSTHASRIDANISSRQADAGLTTTHASRIDASISSRALETTAQAIKAKTDLLSAGYIKSSSTVRLNIDAERVSNSTLYRFLMKSTGTVNISFDSQLVSTTVSSLNLNISVRTLGIEMYTSTVDINKTTYATKTLTSVPVYGGVVEVVITGGGGSAQFKTKSFKVMYDDDNLATPTQL